MSVADVILARRNGKVSQNSDKPINPKPKRIPDPQDVRQPPTLSPVIRRLSDVQPETVNWLWAGKLALGKLTLFSGDPGLGKSFVTCDIASRVSTGAGWPDEPKARRKPAEVILLNAEDDVADTIRPRLDRAGADVSKIVTIDGISQTDAEGRTTLDPLALDAHIDVIDDLLGTMPDCRLVIIDPVSAYCGKTDSHNDAAVRRMLAPLAALAGRRKVAVLALSHLNKGSKTKAVYRTMGSLAFAAAARSVWAFVRDPQSVDRVYFLNVKSNLFKNPHGLAYSIDGGCVAWEAETVTKSPDEIIADEERQRQNPEAAAEALEICDWLKDQLREGPLPQKLIVEDGKAHGFSLSRLRRALKKIGGIPEKTGMDGGWQWLLTDTRGEDYTKVTNLSDTLAVSSSSSSSSSKITKEAEGDEEVPF